MFRKALELHPTYVEAHFNLGWFSSPVAGMPTITHARMHACNPTACLVTACHVLGDWIQPAPCVALVVGYI